MTTRPALLAITLAGLIGGASPLAAWGPIVHELVTEEARLVMHPTDAAARRLDDGATVRVFNTLGEVVVPVRISRRIREGVVSLPKGLWARHTRNGATANALIPDHLTDIGEGPAYNDARVEVERATSGSPSTTGS